MRRRYEVKHEGSGPHYVAFDGESDYGRINAAQDYVRTRLPGYELVSMDGGASFGTLSYRGSLYHEWRLHAVNFKTNQGIPLWVREHI